LPDGLAFGIIVRVVLEIVHDKEIGGREGPDRALRGVIRRINRIGPPVIGGIPLKHSGVEAFGTKGHVALVLG